MLFILCGFYNSPRFSFRTQNFICSPSAEDKTKATQMHPFSPHPSEVGALVLTGYLLLAWVVRITTTTLQDQHAHAHDYRH